MIRAVVITEFLFLFLAGCLFGAAGRFFWPMAWFVLVIYAAPHVATFIFVKPDLIKERSKPGKGVDRIDRVIATLGYLGLYQGTYIVAGLDSVRFYSAVSIPTSVQLSALVVYTLGYVFAFWAVLSNPFF